MVVHAFVTFYTSSFGSLSAFKIDVFRGQTEANEIAAFVSQYNDRPLFVS
jgi:hypothetical protein